MVSGEAYERYQTEHPSFGSTPIPTAFPSSASTHSTALHPEIVDSDLLAALGHQRGWTHAHAARNSSPRSSGRFRARWAPDERKAHFEVSDGLAPMALSCAAKPPVGACRATVELAPRPGQLQASRPLAGTRDGEDVVMLGGPHRPPPARKLHDLGWKLRPRPYRWRRRHGLLKTAHHSCRHARPARILTSATFRRLGAEVLSLREKSSLWSAAEGTRIPTNPRSPLSRR
jgi:hypothetical protein